MFIYCISIYVYLEASELLESKDWFYFVENKAFCCSTFFSIKKKKKNPDFQSPANNTLNVSARFANRLRFIFQEYAYAETYYSGNIWLSSRLSKTYS
jgi:hypothetical protein